MPRTRVWIDDPHPIFRRGLSATLSDDYWVVGQSAGLRPVPPTGHAHVILFNLTLSTLRQVHLFADKLALIALVPQKSEDLCARALNRGVAGLISREELSIDRLRDTIQAALAGQTSVPTDFVLGILRAAENVIDPERAGLLSRELDVLRHLAEGGDTKTIAAQMSYSERTVKNVVHDVLIKMNCRNRAHAVAMAARQGLI